MEDHVSGPSSRERPSSSLRRDGLKLAAFFLLAGCAAATWVWFQTRGGGGLQTHARSGTATAADVRFVREQSCRECHPGESAAHSQSGHSRTLRPAATGPLARLLDGRRVNDPEKPGVTWQYALKQGRLFVTRSGDADEGTLPIDFALGSGHHATTFVTLAEGAPGQQAGLEHRLTFFTQSQELGLTPGQHEFSKVGQSPFGYVLPPGQLQDCFNCHSTRTSSTDPRLLDLATMIPNISCERCHGPGAEHVEKARRGSSADSLTMLLGASSDASEEVRTCGSCHRLPGALSPSDVRPDNAILTRFPSVGLVQSKCFTASGGAMRCSTCHDPHSRVSRDQAGYEQACLSCHGSSPQRVCPTSPRTACLSCHMPRRDVGRDLSFSDHWIRVPEPK